MAKFRKRPVVVEAFQWDGGEVPGFRRINVGRDGLGSPCFNLELKTKNGLVYAKFGDWVIAEMDGSGHYPCAKHVFEATYEPAE